jgi:hypothetical protein
MIGPKIAKRLHCHLTDREVYLEMDPNRGALNTQFNPAGYDMGMKCNCQAECEKREIKCQVYDPNGRFPFMDEEVLNLQSAVLNFRTLAQERLARFKQWSLDEMLSAVQSSDASLRREVAFYLRFRKDDPETIWHCVEVLIDPRNLLNDHASRVEAIESVALWIAEVRPVPKEKFRALLEQLAVDSGPVAQREGEKFTLAVRAFLADLDQ